MGRQLTEALDWSAVKTSSVRFEMAEVGRFEEFDPDGEDVVSLPDDAE